MSKKYKYWSCKIIVPDDEDLPDGFDSPPRKAACSAVSDAGVQVVACSSGWGGTLTENQYRSLMGETGE